MADVHSRAVRSKNMAAVRRRDTKPEMKIRRALHAQGYRYRLDDKELPGRPDLVLPKYRAAIFVHGCFWHRHDCDLFKMPRSQAEFWQEKLAGNKARDERKLSELLDKGWRVAWVWECALRGRGRLDQSQLIARLTGWLRSDTPRLDLAGN